MELIKISFLDSIFNACQSNGINYHKISRKTDLKYFDYFSSDSVIPFETAEAFIRRLSEDQCLDNIAFEFSSYIASSALSDFGYVIKTSPTLLDALVACCMISSAVMSNERMTLKFLKKKAIFFHRLDNISPSEFDKIMQINFVYILDAFDFLTSDGWYPDEIHCQSGFKPRVLDRFPHFYKTKLVLGQPQTAIVFKTAEISHSNARPSLLGGSADSSLLHGLSLSKQIERLIDSFSGVAGRPNMVKIAHLLGLSERTLRRRLVAEDKTFNEILSSWRIRKTVELMQNPTCSITEISQRLHYTNANNFSRAFHKVFHCSPSHYRELH